MASSRANIDPGSKQLGYQAVVFGSFFHDELTISRGSWPVFLYDMLWV